MIITFVSSNYSQGCKVCTSNTNCFLELHALADIAIHFTNFTYLYALTCTPVYRNSSQQ